MTALLAMFSSTPFAAVWGKVKLGLLVSAVSFMVWQGFQMTNLQHDVTNLETVQSSLQAQVQQMSIDYSTLRDNYKNSAKTSEQYIESITLLNGKSSELEKSFSALEVKAASASRKADTALSRQTGTTPGVSNETRSAQALTSTDGDVSGGDDRTDAEWRQLLDNTYCSLYPADTKCPQ